MRAVRLYGAGDLRVETVERPRAPTGDGVHLRVRAAGICGSDLHNFQTGRWITRAPSTPGHELTGEVIAVGAGVARLRVGDIVVADSRFWCGRCPACLRGRPNLCATLGYVGEVCDGGFAEEVVLPERLLHPVDPGLDPAIAAMAEPLAVALHAVGRLRAEAGAPVLVAGCGTIGGLAALVLALAGHRVLVADRNAPRLAVVAAVTGAVPVALDPSAVAAALGGAPPLHAVEATGSAAALQALLGAVSNGARIALVGIGHGGPDLDSSGLVEREIDAVGCSAFSDELPEAIARLPDLVAAVTRLIDRRVTLDEVPAAYRHLAGGEATGLKVMVIPSP